MNLAIQRRIDYCPHKKRDGAIKRLEDIGLIKFIHASFNWRETPEGFHFWDNIVKGLENETNKS